MTINKRNDIKGRMKVYTSFLNFFFKISFRMMLEKSQNHLSSTPKCWGAEGYKGGPWKLFSRQDSHLDISMIRH